MLIRSAILTIVFIAVLGWSTQPPPIAPERLSILVRYIPTHDGATLAHWKTGVVWTLSYLGATWPAGSLNEALRPVDGQIYQLDFIKAGLPEQAHAAMAMILDSLKQSEEYRGQCAIDFGRLAMLTVYSSWHYYRLTGTERQVNDFIRKHALKSEATQIFPAVYSSVAKGNRILYVQKKPTEGNFFAYLAEEGDGDLRLNNFVATEFETYTLMSNGQLRFAIYDRSGNLEAATPTHLGEAGKPAKCQWCHESNLQPLYRSTHDLAGYLSPDEFNAEIKRHQVLIDQYRNGLNTEIKFNQAADHTYAELIYISFMEPSAQRIAEEWSCSKQAVQLRLQGLGTHQHPEFPQLGELYHRADIDRMAAFVPVRVSDFVREPGFEPDWWQNLPQTGYK